MNKLPDLPPSTDEDYWGDAHRERHHGVAIAICERHTRENWTEHHAYLDNHDGTISCKFCPWGTILPVGYRVYQNRIVDLASVTRE